MGRKKKKSLKPWCWYCNREFDDEKVLIGHQKAKHFRCHICHKKLYTAPGLAIHCSQVHKETINKVPNALPERETLDLEIYGMEGVPDEAKHAREIQKYGRLTEETTLEAKRPKLDPSSTGFQGVMPGGGFPPVIMPGMPPVLPGMVPPTIGVPPSGGILPPSTGMLAPPQKPLFPSAANQPSSSVTDPTPTGAAPPPQQAPLPPVVPEILKNAPHVNPLPENSKLMHPLEDLSMEEIRALRPQYSGTTPPGPITAVPQTNNSLPPSAISPAPLPSQFPNRPPMFRPDMVRPGLQPPPGPMIRPGMTPAGFPPPGGGIRPPMGQHV